MDNLKFKLIPEKVSYIPKKKGVHPNNKPTNKYAPRTRISKKFDDISQIILVKSPIKIKNKLTLSPISLKNK